jgi:hypothetical protein
MYFSRVHDSGAANPSFGYSVPPPVSSLYSRSLMPTRIWELPRIMASLMFCLRSLFPLSSSTRHDVSAFSPRELYWAMLCPIQREYSPSWKQIHQRGWNDQTVVLSLLSRERGNETVRKTNTTDARSRGKG